MSTLRLNLLMNLNHFEATTIMEVAIRLNVPIIQFHPDTLTSSLEKVIKPEDFDVQVSGAVFLNDDGRKKVLSKWQEKKRTDMIHPYLKEKIPMGLLPYVQSMLLAKFVRGEIDEYPCYLAK